MGDPSIVEDSEQKRNLNLNMKAERDSRCVKRLGHLKRRRPLEHGSNWGKAEKASMVWQRRCASKEVWH